MRKKKVYFRPCLPASIDPAKISNDLIKLLTYMVWKSSGKGEFRRLVPLPKGTLRILFGGRASAVAAAAVRDGWIVPCLHKSGVAYSKKKGICKHYKLAGKLQRQVDAGQVVVVDCNHPRLYPAKKRADKKGCEIAKMYEEITIEEAWQDMPMDGRFFSGRIYAGRIDSGEIGAKTSATGRIYHPLICVAKEFRKFVRFRGRPISYLDAKSCHPWMLGKFAAPGAEREHWLELCKNDIYRTPEYGREEMKEGFQIALSDCRKRGAGKIMWQLIKREAPGIAAWIGSQWAIKSQLGDMGGNTVQAALQRMEAAIFVGEFQRLKNRFWCLPMHDGLALMPENMDEAESAIQAAARRVLGFELQLERL